jgi:DNA-binding LytR/AlgR family response regulator
MNVRCIIIEDEKPAQEVLRSYIDKVAWLELIAVFDDAVSSLEFLKENEIELIFLDVQMPTLNGIDFLRILKNSPQVILTTASSDYALEAFELDVRDYLKKPFSLERFLKAIGRVAVHPEQSQVHQFSGKNIEESFAFFNVNKTMVRVLFDEILYIESMREYIYLHTDKCKVVTKMGISEIEKMLGGNFIRVHRSFIVNIKKVTAFNAEDVFINTTPLPIGASYKSQVETFFRKHTF